MSHQLIDRYRRRLAAESGLHSNPWGGRLSVALVYPNTYHQEFCSDFRGQHTQSVSSSYGVV